jgi:NAD(P)-dependent dehydrogenase (short-subunit alcohol dehydrogenase family)
MLLNRIQTEQSGLTGSVVIVTGASSGLGAQLAAILAAAGAIPVLAARRADRLAELSVAIPQAMTVTRDVTEAADRERLVEAVLDRHGRIDGLVNNAGMGATGPALQLGADAFARVLNLNLAAPFALSCLVAQAMRAGGDGGRSIVNVASVMDLRSLGEIPGADSLERLGHDFETRGVAAEAGEEVLDPGGRGRANG